jgi:hypothetical protein
MGLKRAPVPRTESNTEMRTALTILKATAPVFPLAAEAAGIQPMKIDALAQMPLTLNQIVSWTRS